MPHQPLVSWKSVLQQIAQLPAQNSALQRVSAGRIIDLVDSFHDCSIVSRANWKELLKFETPKHLAAACCTFQLNSSSSSSSSSGSSNSSNACLAKGACCLAVWHALLSFLKRATEELLMDRNGNVDVARASSSSLLRSLTQQVQSSGLLQQFPAILSAAALVVQGLTNQAAAAPAPSAAAAASLAAAVGHADAALLAPAAVAVRTQDFPAAVCMLELATVISPYQPTEADTFTVFPAAASLALAMLRHMTTVLPLLSDEQAAAFVYRKAADALPNVLLNIARLVTYPQGDHLLDFPDIVSTLSVVVFVEYARTYLPKRKAAAATSSSSSRRSSSRRSGQQALLDPEVAAVTASSAAAAAALKKQQRKFAWEATAQLRCLELQQQQQQRGLRQQQQQQQEEDPPGPSDVCLRLTGVSMRAVAWLAGYMYGSKFDRNQTINSAALSTTLLALDALLRSYARIANQQQQQQQQGLAAGPPLHSAHQPAIQLLLLAQVLLSCVDRQRSSSTFVAVCRMAVAMTANALLYAVKRHTPGAHPDSGRLLVWLWWPEVLPLLLRLMSHVQQQLLAAADHQAAAAAAAAAAASSSSSGVQAGQRPGATVVLAAADPAMGSLVLPLVQLLADASIYTADWGAPTAAAAAAGQPSSSRRQAAASVGDCVQLPRCWCEHSVQVSTVLEGLLRVQARGGLVPVADTSRCIAHLVSLFSSEGPVVIAAMTGGHGSKEQLQLFSVLCSVLKLCDYIRPIDSRAACTGYGLVALAAVALLVGAVQVEPLQPAAQPAAATEPVAAAAEGLPWLVMIGRCCCGWATELQQLQDSRPGLGQQLLLLAQGQAVTDALGVSPGHAAAVVLNTRDGFACGIAKSCRDWLQQQDTAGELAAAGYPVQSLLQQLGATVAAMGAPVAAADAESALVAYSGLVRELTALGVALTSLAIPHACNNPSCSNMAGETELGSVSGRSCLCAGCLTGRNCSRVCQKQHWKQHKPVCKALAAAAADPVNTP